MRIQAETGKVKAKTSEQQARLKKLEQRKLEVKNNGIVDIVRGVNIPLTELPLMSGKPKGDGASGQIAPRSEPGRKEES